MGSISPAHYVVEKILGIAIDANNQKYYKLQWAPTWEKEEKLIGCQELVQGFLRAQQNEVNAGVQENIKIKQENNQVVPNEQTSECVDVKQVVPNDAKPRVVGAEDSQQHRANSYESWFDMESGSAPSSDNTSLSAEMSIPLECEQGNENAGEKNLVESNSPDKCTSVTTTPTRQVKKQCNMKYLLQKGKQRKNSQVLHIEEGFFKCNECGGRFETVPKLQLHIRNKCNKVDRLYVLRKNKILGSPPNMYRCVGCEKAFSSSPLLRKHIKKHTGSLECSICAKRFTRYHSLNLHMMNMHTIENEDDLHPQKTFDLDERDPD